MNVPQSSTTRLQQILLSWDYWALADRTETGEGAMETLKAVPDTFASIQVQHHLLAVPDFCYSCHMSDSQTWVQDYIAVFEPLVLEECGALLLRGNEEASMMQPHQAVVAVVSTVSTIMSSMLTVSPLCLWSLLCLCIHAL